MYRRSSGSVEVLLAHPGGPFWTRKDLGAWTIPKGEVEAAEDPMAAACREFREETGLPVGATMVTLGQLKQRSGKVIHAWAFEGDCVAASIRSQTFTMEWPPRSGQSKEFPEVDRAEWFSIDEALKRINPGQAGFIHELLKRLGVTPGA
jgi:predicted NUDIX family NTP pyrophosphohydrolase